MHRTPMPAEQTIEHTSYSSKPLETSKVSLTCISPAGHVGASTFCFGKDEPLLRLYSAGPSQPQALYNRILRLAGGAVAGDLKLTHSGRVVLNLHIDSLEPLDMNNSAAFTAPANSELVPLPHRVYVSAAVAQGMLEVKFTPEYPFATKAKQVTGTVSLQAVIGTDRKIKELEVIGGPAVLRKAALDAVRQWRYRPYLLNGAPVEVKTIMNVIFALG